MTQDTMRVAIPDGTKSGLTEGPVVGDVAPHPRASVRSAEARHALAGMRHDPLAIRRLFETGAYP